MIIRMADSGEGEQYSRDDKTSIERFSIKDQVKSNKSSEMVLNLGSKSEAFASDQTPTPIRLIQKCEEMGLFQDLQSVNVNPFEETFRKAAEGIRSGTTSLEVSSLSVPNYSDDSLHTPHVIFPPVGELSKVKRAISPRDDLSISSIQSDSDPLCISLDTDETSKAVVQQEADTSQQTQNPDLNNSANSDGSPYATIQFLLRMPNGKMVQLSSLPVEQMDATPTESKDIPIIKVDSSFLKSVDGATKETSSLSSTVIAQSNNVIALNAYSSTTNVVSSDDETVVSRTQSISGKKQNMNSIKNVDNGNASEQFSKMALAKLKLKQALMNNSRPAANLSSSFNRISSTSTSSSNVASSTTSQSQAQFVAVRRPSSTSDEGGSRDDAGRDVSSIEEKRRRNRAAAMRCREKRKTWVKELERRANDMLRTNGQLQYEVSLLRDEVAQLKTLLLAHRDCPVTQALVQGKATLPEGTNISTVINNTSSRRSSMKEERASSSAPVIRTPTSSNQVKPVILLNDPPIKRKRLTSSTNSSIAVGSSAGAVSVVASSSSTTSSVHTLVLPSKNTSVLNPSFLNVIPSVLVANPTTSSSNSVIGTSQVVYSQFLPCLPPLTRNPGLVVQGQPYILPKSSASNVTSEKSAISKQSKPRAKPRSAHLRSTNVIKVNPNVVECENDDSDIEILDVNTGDHPFRVST